MINLNNYVCSLDIGSSKLAACVAQIRKKKFSRIFFASAPSKGVKSGMIVDAIELVGSVGKLLKELSAKSGIRIKYIYTNISGQDIVSKHSRAIVPLADRGNKVVTVSDIERANEQARILGSSLEEDIIHTIPSGYTIDSKSNIINPIGLYSHKLEVDLYLICGKLSSIQSLNRSINQSGFEVKNLFFSGLATSKAALSHEFKEGITIFCDIGADITEILLFRDGLLKDIEILPVGGDNLTAELSLALKIPWDLAEEIKKSHGMIGDPQKMPEDKEILVRKSNLYKPIKQKMVAEVLTEAARSVAVRIKETVEKKALNYEVNNFIVVGRSVLLEGFIEMLENTLAVPARLGRITDPQIITAIRDNAEASGQKYLNYITCLGMLYESIHDNKSIGVLPSQKPSKNILIRSLKRAKEVYEEYF